MNGRNGSQPQPLRSMNMNTYGAQQGPRQTSRLQNTQKTGLGNGNAGAGWAFGAPSTGGFGGLGGAPGLGAARPGQLSGFAQIMGGGSSQSQIDMNDFPSLSGPARPQQSSGWNSNVIRQPQQAQPQQPQPSAQPHRAPSTAPSHHSIDQFDGPRLQQAPADRGEGDDFQSMNGQGSANADASRQAGFGSSVLGSPNDSNPPVNGQLSQLPVRDSSNSFLPTAQAPIGSTQPTPPAQALSQSPSVSRPNGQTGDTASEPSIKKWAEMTEKEKWGMAGLNAIFEARRQSETGSQIDETLPPHIRNTAVIMGQDLNTLGMDLDSPEDLHPTFSVWPSQHQSDSIFNYRDHHPVPAFQVPPAYTVTNVPPMQTRMGAFSDETLLQIFFQMPRDIMQELAATELSMRDWRWHKVIRQWLQKDTREANSGSSLPINDLTNGIPIGQPAVRLDERSERGVYIFFDHNNWRRQRREFTLHYDELHVNTLPAAVAGSNGTAAAQAGSFGGMTGMQGGQVGGQPSIERQSSVISGAN